MDWPDELVNASGLRIDVSKDMSNLPQASLCVIAQALGQAHRSDVSGEESAE